MFKYVSSQSFVLLMIFGIFMSACRSTLVPYYEYNISKIGVDISKHNTEYQIPSDSIFLGSTQKKIDEFDLTLFNSLNNRLQERGYALNQLGQLQTYRLNDCLIEFNKQKPELTIKGLDSIYQSSLLTTIVCKEVTDTAKLFFASYKSAFNYDFRPINSFSTTSNQSPNWQFSKNYTYIEKPFNSTQTEEIAENLAKNMYQKIDAANVKFFKSKYPDIYNSKVKVKENLAGEILLTLLGVIFLIIIAH